MDMDASILIRALSRTGELLQANGPVEILLIGGAAGMITTVLDGSRTTADCDVLRCHPPEAMPALEQAARLAASELDLPDGWLSNQAGHLDVLPDRWRGRRKHVGTWGLLTVYAAGHRDLLATKFYANRPQDREDIQAMGPTLEDRAFVRTYLTMLRVPSRGPISIR